MTKEEIKNLALTEINHENISDWEDELNTDIPVINQQYNLAKLVALAKYQWSFATKYASLATTPVPKDSPFKKYQNQTELPDDVIGYLAAYTNEHCSTLATYEIIGNVLYTNQNQVFLKYTAKIGEEFFTPEFIDWFKVFFASRLNSYLNGDMQRQAYLEGQEPVLFRAAKNIDSKRNKHDSLVTNPFLSARNGFGIGTI
jgi:hypothetical protein